MPSFITTALPAVAPILSSWKFWAAVVLLIALFVVLRRRGAQSESVTIGLPFGLGNVTYSTTPIDRLIAWQFYVQLVTRKAALPFDEEHDLICDVYDSLFQLFNEARQLLLKLPAREFQRKTGLSDLMLRALNDGLRPHLTKWQSKYRKWWNEEIGSTNTHGVSPQEIQRTFPEYQALTTELKIMNLELAVFADELRTIARRERRARRKKRIAPKSPSDTASTAPQRIAAKTQTTSRSSRAS